MNFELLLQNVAQHISTSKEEKEFFKSIFTIRNLKKKEVLLQMGQPCNYFYFVNKGILRAYSINEMGKETTVMFASQSWWITDMYGFAKNKNTTVTIEAIHSAEVLQMNKKGFEDLVNQFPVFEKFYRILFQNAYIREQQRVIQTLSQPAADRYRSFLKQYPTLAQTLPQKQIASYLGISPEFLSTLKSGIK